MTGGNLKAWNWTKRNGFCHRCCNILCGRRAAASCVPWTSRSCSVAESLLSLSSPAKNIAWLRSVPCVVFCLFFLSDSEQSPQVIALLCRPPEFSRSLWPLESVGILLTLKDPKATLRSLDFHCEQLVEGSARNIFSKM